MYKSLSLTCLIFFLSLPKLVLAQSPIQQQLSRKAEAALQAAPANYLAPLDSLRKHKPAAKDLPATDAYQHVMSVYQAFVSNYDSALYYFDQQALAQQPHAPQDYGIDSGFVKESFFRHALTALPKKISQHQVVMLNETYFMPAHRAFAISLLDELYKQGFRHMALETITSSDTASLNQRKYPVHKSGVYQKESLYGELVRQALRKGFSILAYQSEGPCPAELDAVHCNNLRDSIQAQNLARWVRQHPDKKLFVYAGPSQIFENSSGKWKRTATYFKHLSGIDPYTIDQSYMNEHTSPALEDPRYRAAADLKNIQAPMVAYVEDTLWSHSKQVDATIFHPRYLNKTGSLPHYQLKHKRPDFYMLHNKRKPILIAKDPNSSRFSSELLPANTRLIQVFYQKEEGNRVPADVVELKKDQEEAILYLYPGAYEIVYLNKNGKTLMNRPITIN